MLKKYMFMGVVLGISFLTGYENEKVDNTTSSKTSAVEQKVEKETIATTEKAHTPIPLVLTPTQKEQFYKDYTAIVHEFNGEYGTAFVIDPITTFTDEYWLGLRDFKEMLKGRIGTSSVVINNKEVYAPGLVPKLVELQMGSHKIAIRVDGSFDTQLNANTPDGRQLFSALHSLSSKIEQGNGKWKQTGYDPSVVDQGRAYSITVTGYYSFHGVSSPHNFDIIYYCNENGGIT